MKWWGWALSLLPAGVGLLIAALASRAVVPNPVLYLRGNLSVLTLIFGVLLSILIIAVTQWQRNLRQKHHLVIRALLEQASQDRRRFLQRLDHELKNPLTAIQAGLTNLAYEPLDDYPSGEVSAVRAQVNRISQLVADLRKLAVLETTPPEMTQVNVADLLTEVVGIVQEQCEASERKISLILPNAPWPIPDIQGDPDLLLLAIHNLVDNAAKFTQPGDTIEVRAFDEGREVIIEIADTGPGIPEAERAQVWEELYRGQGARGIPGSGLGLPLVRAIIEGHGGSVGLRSRLDQGTVFSLRLPAR